MVKYIFIYLVFLCYPVCIHAQIRIAGIFSDNMVLQRDEKIPVWGSAEPGTIISVEFSSYTVKTLTDKDGKWKAELPPVKAGGPFILTIKSKADRITLKNILIGDVWYASGQSNMEHPMQG